MGGGHGVLRGSVLTMTFQDAAGWTVATGTRRSHLVWNFQVVVGTRGAVEAIVRTTACGAIGEGLGLVADRQAPACRRCLAAAWLRATSIVDAAPAMGRT